MVDGDNFDSQCSCRRKGDEELSSTKQYYHSRLLLLGVLCGSCEDGYGVSTLLNNCVTCHDASGTLIIILCKLSFILCSNEVTLHCINLIIPVSGDIKQALLTLLHL